MLNVILVSNCFLCLFLLENFSDRKGAARHPYVHGQEGAARHPYVHGGVCPSSLVSGGPMKNASRRHRFLRHSDNGGLFHITMINYSQFKGITRGAIKLTTCLLIVVS